MKSVNPRNDPSSSWLGYGVGEEHAVQKTPPKLASRTNWRPMQAMNHYLPVAGMEVIAYDGGQFRGKDFHHSYLKALFEPMIDYKIKTRTLGLDDINDGDLSRTQLAFAPGLRQGGRKGA